MKRVSYALRELSEEEVAVSGRTPRMRLWPVVEPKPLRFRPPTLEFSQTSSMRGMRGTMGRHEQGSGRINVRHCVPALRPYRGSATFTPTVT